LDHVLVSIVIPAYNEAHRLPRSMAKLVPYVRALGDTEVIIVDDGSTDGTVSLAERYLRELPQGRLLRLPWNSGKGSAVRAGVSMARGDAIVFMDADMASDLGDLPRLLAALGDAEVAVGSRRVGDGATRHSWRKAGSWGFNQIIRSLTSLDHADTQCGFKAFRHAEAKLLFSMSRATGFGFDVEVLALAHMLGYRTAEVPITWDEVDGGRFNMVRHTPAMIIDAARAGRLARRTNPRWSAGVSGPVATEQEWAAPDPVGRPVERAGERAAERAEVARIAGDESYPSEPTAAGDGVQLPAQPPGLVLLDGTPRSAPSPDGVHNAGIQQKTAVTGSQREVV
jgi:hypothetical protein